MRDKKKSLIKIVRRQKLAGFTLVEVMLAIIIISSASLGLMKGVSLAKAELQSIRLKERAYEELKNHTEYWKARVAANIVPQQIGSAQGEDVVLLKDGKGNEIIGKLFKSRVTEETTPRNSVAKYYGFRTWIEWDEVFTGKEVSRSLEFKVKQLVFPR